MARQLEDIFTVMITYNSPDDDGDTEAAAEVIDQLLSKSVKKIEKALGATPGRTIVVVVGE